MKNKRFLLVILILFTSLIYSFAQRSEIPFNSNWLFTGGSVSGETVTDSVTLPHTWNASDAQEGMDYFRGEGTYEKTFVPDPSWLGQRVFIRFEGVMTVSQFFLNGEFIGEHRGGYSAFIYEIGSKLNFGSENSIKVVANNEPVTDVIPLTGDFNIYGGIYRPVQLIVTPQVCISPLDHASPGVFLKQTNVSAASANVEVLVRISNASGQNEDLTIFCTLKDADGAPVEFQSKDFEAVQGESIFLSSFFMQNPRLWDGRKDAYLYSVTVELVKNGRVIDSKVQPLGIRFFEVDPDEGFFLNGKSLKLNGISRHQDKKDKGSALTDEDHREDMDIMLEMGINALRLAHYQHSETIYSLADSTGVVVWAELPWVGGPGGFMGETDGYEPTDEFHQNAKQQLVELIRQNYNHPSILFWSIFNEIQHGKKESTREFVTELNDLAKKEDPTRLTVGASMLDPDKEIHDITDVIAWNKYFGWYYSKPEEVGEFLDEIHEKYPEFCIGISEYGAGGSIIQHEQDPDPPNPFGSPHPEEWQSYYHEKHLEQFAQRSFIWGTFIWNMFDFGSHFRREGDHYGINDKGLVTYDRQVKKDAFYFYKANWSEEPFVYITSRRHVFRDKSKNDIKVYSNLTSVTLKINDGVVGTLSPVGGIATWENIELEEGNNIIRVEGTGKGQSLTDQCVWVVEDAFGTKQIAQIFDILQYLDHMIIGVLIIMIWLWFMGWRFKEKRSKWKRVIAKIFFFHFMIIEYILLFIKFFVLTRMG